MSNETLRMILSQVIQTVVTHSGDMAMQHEVRSFFKIHLIYMLFLRSWNNHTVVTIAEV